MARRVAADNLRRNGRRAVRVNRRVFASAASGICSLHAALCGGACSYEYRSGSLASAWRLDVSVALFFFSHRARASLKRSSNKTNTLVLKHRARRYERGRGALASRVDSRRGMELGIEWANQSGDAAGRTRTVERATLPLRWRVAVSPHAPHRFDIRTRAHATPALRTFAYLHGWQKNQHQRHIAWWTTSAHFVSPPAPS